MRAIAPVVLAFAALFSSACSSASSNPLMPAMAVSATSSTEAQAGGGPSSFDATGLWAGLVFIAGDRIGSGVHVFTQLPSGSITGTGSEPPDDPERDHGIYTFKRLGSPNGTIRRFRFTLFMPPREEGACARDLSGDAELNTETNTMTATGTGVIDNCETVTVTFKWTKL